MNSCEIKYKGLLFDVYYTYESGSVFLTSIWYGGADVTLLLETLQNDNDIDLSHISELVEDKESAKKYDKDYDL